MDARREELLAKRRNIDELNEQNMTTLNTAKNTAELNIILLRQMMGLQYCILSELRYMNDGEADS